MPTSKYTTDDWVSPIGGNWAFWARNVKIIREYIQEYGLTPVTITATAGTAKSASLTPKLLATRAVLDLGIRGGIRPPHFHYQDRIYMLDQKQWNAFSKNIVTNFKTALSKSRTISFDQAMVLDGVTQKMEQG